MQFRSAENRLPNRDSRGEILGVGRIPGFGWSSFGSGWNLQWRIAREESLGTTDDLSSGGAHVPGSRIGVLWGPHSGSFLLLS